MVHVICCFTHVRKIKMAIKIAANMDLHALGVATIRWGEGGANVAFNAVLWGDKYWRKASI